MTITDTRPRLSTSVTEQARDITDTTVAVIGSPSTTTSLTLNVLRAAYQQPLYGKMLAVALPTRTATGLADTWQVALGTVTNIETTNPAHTARAAEAPHVAQQGQIQVSGDEGDTRTLTVAVEAVFTQAGRDDTGRPWQPAGASLVTSPATGTPARILNAPLMDELMQQVPAKRFIGTLHGTDVPLPWTAREFTGSRGATHDAVIGQTGAGKSVTAAYMMATDLRHEGMGQVVFDPQGQWATEHGLPFSLQGLATAVGRQVTVARLSRSLRLDKDAGMFTDLLIKAGLLQRLTIPPSATDQINAASRSMAESLRDYDGDWTTADPAAVLVYLLEHLRDTLAAGLIYAGREGANRVRWAIARPDDDEAQSEGLDPAMTSRMPPGVLDDQATNGRRWGAVLALTAPLHNLFSPYTPDGAVLRAAGEKVGKEHKRTSMWGLLRGVFNPPPGQAAPWLILDLSADPVHTVTRHEDDGVDAADADAAADAWRVLDDPGVKARIMRRLLTDLSEAGLTAFRGGSLLNVRVTFDEAWQYAGTPLPGQDQDIVALSDQLVAGVRDLRKIGVGVRFITQSPTSIREEIWKQLASRVIGWGLTEQTDMRRLANIVGDTHLGLYTSTAGPDATGRYTFMVTGGGVTGLSFGHRPVFMDMYTSPQQFLATNGDWLTGLRRTYAHRLPAGDSGAPLTTMPGRPESSDPLVEQMRTTRAKFDGRANAPAAARLGSAAGQRTKFGMQGPAPASKDDWGDPPF